MSLGPILVSGGGTPFADPNAASVGLHLAWDEGAGAAADLGPNGISITNGGTPTQHNDDTVSNLIDYDGSTDISSFSYNAVMSTDNDWTLEIGLVADATGAQNVARMLGSGGGWFAQIDNTTPATFLVQLRRSGETPGQVISDDLVLGQFYSFMITHDFSTGGITMYQDGRIVATSSITNGAGNWDTSGEGILGGNAGPAAQFNGKAWMRFTKGVIRTKPWQGLLDPLREDQ